jgi:flagellar basal-body rod modification protein FlgD
MPSPLTGSSPQTAPAPVPPNPKGDMSSQDTFMKLLVAELKHQDPMDPVQSRDMVAQLAQLSSVQKLSAIDEKMGALQRGTLDGSSLQSANLIGKNVTAKTNRLTLNSIGSPVGAYVLQNDAQNVKVEVVNSTGQTVTAMDLGPLKAGDKQFEWNGQDQGGRRVPNGKYTFKVTATDAQGAPVVTTSEVSGLVKEVTYTNGTPEVVVGNVHVGLSDVTSIAQ